MAEATMDQSQTFMLWFMMLLGAVVIPYSVFTDYVEPLMEPAGNDPADPAIKRSAFLVPLLWLCGPLAFAVAKWRGVQSLSRWHRIGIQVSWASACAVLLLHIAVAFHLGHGWSHEAAWEHTKQVGGYGDGIYVNYA